MRLADLFLRSFIPIDSQSYLLDSSQAAKRPNESSECAVVRILRPVTTGITVLATALQRPSSKLNLQRPTRGVQDQWIVRASASLHFWFFLRRGLGFLSGALQIQCEELFEDLFVGQ